jgi:hypothetical protein
VDAILPAVGTNLDRHDALTQRVASPISLCNLEVENFLTRLTEGDVEPQLDLVWPLSKWWLQLTGVVREEIRKSC